MAKYWTDGTSLYHYEIPGQKWGVQNGPPYPLGIKQLSSRERHKRYDKKRSSKLKLTDKERQLARIGLALAVTGLAVYGSYKLNQLPSVSYDYMSIVKDALPIDNSKIYSTPDTNPYWTAPYEHKNFELSKSVKDFANRNNIPIKNVMRSVDEDINAILAVRPPTTSKDCVVLAFTMCLRRMGLDVYPDFSTKGVYMSKYDEYFKGFNTNNHSLIKEFGKISNSINKESVEYKELCSNIVLNKLDELCKYSNNACGVMAVQVKGSKDSHLTPWFKENGIIRFGDPQGISRDSFGLLLGREGLISFDKGFEKFSVCRIDNLEPQDALLNGYLGDRRAIIKLEK